MTSSGREKFQLPIFNGSCDNFLFWTGRIEAALLEKVCRNILSESVAPSSNEDKAQAAKASSVILRGLGDVPLVEVIRHKSNPTKMWSAVKERYASETTFNKATVQMEIANLEYDGHQSIEDFVAQFEHHAARLEAMGSGIEESMMVTLFLSSLGPPHESPYGSAMSALQTK